VKAEPARAAATGSPAEGFALLVETLPAVVYEAEAAGPGSAWRYLSPQIETLLGYKAEDWIAEPDLWWDRIHPDDRATVDSLEQRERELAKTLGATSVSEYRMLHRDGSVVWVRDDARLIVPETGRPYWRGVFSDITAERETERALGQAFERYRDLVDSLPVCVYRAEPSPSGRWEVVSSQIERLLGYSPEEWLADPMLWESRLHVDDRARVLKNELEHMQMPLGTQWVSEYRLRHQSGDAVWVRDRAVVTRGSDGRRVRDGIMIDITPERETEVSQALDVYRLTCSQCGDSWAAYRLEPCQRCKVAEVHSTSMNEVLRELAISRGQVEGLLDGIREHLEVVTTRLEHEPGVRAFARREGEHETIFPNPQSQPVGEPEPSADDR
jgi:PAS domain S-box-containing protein